MYQLESKWYFCRAVVEAVVLVWSENCFLCIDIIARHTNVLQYKESHCTHRQSLAATCNSIRTDAILKTLVRASLSSSSTVTSSSTSSSSSSSSSSSPFQVNAVPIQCPFNKETKMEDDDEDEDEGDDDDNNDDVDFNGNRYKKDADDDDDDGESEGVKEIKKKDAKILYRSINQNNKNNKIIHNNNIIYKNGHNSNKNKSKSSHNNNSNNNNNNNNNNNDDYDNYNNASYYKGGEDDDEDDDDDDDDDRGYSGDYQFVYSNHSGGFCRTPPSTAHPCSAGSKYRFRFKKCPGTVYTSDAGL
ncbi:hypothetical protein HELRODRAFT_167554 [Helobdella robusta]|uniref:Uncharacterized protein n=1 Tax=Helobdella robusta TaxID=6412 RepID=T1EZH5_HELRO|nr:hypothetical protein HELRODRAFT_167554 [Helobdella robusta]ESO11034.1 hypothetical protein HELRODRAFT_167554 [Helobdella robusta]